MGAPKFLMKVRHVQCRQLASSQQHTPDTNCASVLFWMDLANSNTIYLLTHQVKTG